MNEINANTASSMSTLRSVDSATIQRLARKYFAGKDNAGVRSAILKQVMADLNPDTNYTTALSYLENTIALTASGKAALASLGHDLDSAHSYRLVVGETGNEQGHIVACHAITRADAEKALARAVAPYKGEGWGRIEMLINGR